MKKSLLAFALVASLAAACRSAEKDPPPPETAAAPPAETAQRQPMAPILALPAARVPTAEPAAPVAEDSRAGRLAALEQESDAAMNAYYEAMQKAIGDKEPTPEDWQRIQAEVKEPDTAGFLARAQKLLDEDATDETAFRTIQWMLDNARSAEARPPLLALLERHHMGRLEMGELCERLVQDGRRLVEKLLADSPHRAVRGRACFALAEGLKSELDRAESLRTMPPEELEGMRGYLGVAKLAELQQLDAGKAGQELERWYERVVREFGDVELGAGTKRATTLGARAGAALFEMQNLVVGKPAPEIEGTDLDGVAFKLSDYRGKVVLLDFWGNW